MRFTIRSFLFSVLFFFANWGLLTEIVLPYGRRGIAGRTASESGGELILVLGLSATMFTIHRIMQKINFGEGHIVRGRERSLWPVEVFILAITAGINYWLFYT